MEPLFFFLPMILFIGGITTYQDIKYGKIKNIWIMLALAYAVIANIALVIVVTQLGQDVRPAYFIELSVSVAISLFIGFAMWWIGLWTAGDAKLFTAFTALIPLTVYKYGHVPYFSSSNVLINTFVPFFVMYFFMLMFRTTIKQKIHYMLKSLEPKQLLFLFLFLFAFMWPTQLFFSLTNIPANYFYSIVFLFLMMVVFEKIFGKRFMYVLVVLGIIRVIFDPSLLSTNTLYSLLSTMAGFVFLRFFILYAGYDLLTVNTDIGLLKKGMVPAELIYKEGKKFRKQRILMFSMLSYLAEAAKKRDYVFETAAEGLTERDVAKLKKHKLGFEHLRIYKTLSFAPYLFAGVILTIIFQGDMFIAIALLI